MPSSLIIDGKPLIVIRELANAVGLNEAIVIQQVHWLSRESTYIAEGHTWAVASYEDWRRNNFPFWSIATIRRVFSSLEDRGLLISTDAYNVASFDRTKWYRVNHDHPDIADANRSVEERKVITSNGRNQQVDLSKSAGRPDHSDRTDDHSDQVDLLKMSSSSIDLEKSYEREKKENMAEQARPRSTSATRAQSLIQETDDPNFDRWWMIYPRRVKKDRAKKAWADLAPDDDLANTIIDATERQVAADHFNGVEYAPHPSTWLNDRRWEDEVIVKNRTSPSGVDKSWKDEVAAEWAALEAGEGDPDPYDAIEVEYYDRDREVDD